MIDKTTIGAGALCGLLTIPALAWAQPTPFIGASYGYVKAHDLEINDVAVGDDLEDFDDDRTTYKGFVGFELTDWLALEAAYVELGDFEDSGFEVDNEGYTAAAIVGIPFNEHVTLFAKGGQLWWESDATGPAGFDERREGETPFWGAGLEIGFFQPLAIRIEYERFDLDDDNVDGAIDYASAGVQFGF